MSCVTGSGRMILIFLNIIILLIGVAAMTAGIILKFFFNVVSKFIFDIGDGSNAFNVPDSSQSLHIPMAAEAGVVLIVFGAILFLISFTACCGACGKWRPLLITFTIVMILFIIGQATVAGLFFTEDSVLHTTIKDVLTTQVREEFNATGSSLFDVSINAMHVMLECCGLSGWADFDAGQKPASCCNRTLIFTEDPSLDADKDQCSNSTSNGPDYMYNEKGCYDKLVDMVMDNLIFAAVGLGATITLEIIEVVFACLIVKEENALNKAVGPV